MFTLIPFKATLVAKEGKLGRKIGNSYLVIGLDYTNNRFLFINDESIFDMEDMKDFKFDKLAPEATLHMTEDKVGKELALLKSVVKEQEKDIAAITKGKSLLKG